MSLSLESAAARLSDMHAGMRVISNELLHFYSLALDEKISVISEIRDQMEMLQSQEYSMFLTVILPAVDLILSQTPPVFSSQLPEQVYGFILICLSYVRRNSGTPVSKFSNAFLSTMQWDHTLSTWCA